MLRKFGSHLRDQWIGTLSLFLVLSGGTAWAVDGPLAGQDTVGSSDIIDGEVFSADLRNNQVTSADVRDDTLANGGLGGADIANEGLTGDDIKNSSLNGGELSPATLGPREIIFNSLTSQVIANDAIGYGELSAAAFNSEFADTGAAFGIADNSIQSNEVSDGSLTGADISENAIPADGTGNNGSTKLSTNSVGYDEIDNNAVQTGSVLNDTLLGSDINESTLGPSAKAFGSRRFDTVSVPSATPKGVLAKGVPNGTYMVMATLYGRLGSNGDDKEWLSCTLRANNTEIARQITILREPTHAFGDPGIAEYQSLTLLGWGTVSSGVNNIFLECSGGPEVTVDRPTIGAIQVHSVG